MREREQRNQDQQEIQKPERPTLRERAADALDISKEVLLDTVLITCIGNREMTLENYKGIIEYTDTCIRVKAKPNAVRVTGENLELRNISRELLYITGKISEIGFCRS
ncbi:YabP/YqfC family sporulation protein [Ructibacterium gallinarum]|uniref:Sporulation protein n=1 Tax=Ructibacterium gallinarum TaxID=2779355 RepID=A0A9D5M5R6_9FIRM|nr:YabP/YqfC family sporulation protein [Ructibacterium gallinarum]MBE5040069.1 sporulation protein [Ructibacterium gallinarum]